MKPTGKQLRTDPGYRNTNMYRSSLLVHTTQSGQIKPTGIQFRQDPAYRTPGTQLRTDEAYR